MLCLTMVSNPCVVIQCSIMLADTLSVAHHVLADETPLKIRLTWASATQAFIWWQSTGTESKSGKEDSLYGLNLLVINQQGKVQKCVGFRQLTSGELEKHVKLEVQR